MSSTDLTNPTRELHIFTDASERIYGAVAYVRTVLPSGDVQVTFVLARSRVAPKKQTSIPRLELCGALIGAQLSDTLRAELTISIHNVYYWTDSTTVLAWLKSESCSYKVFVGTRIAEIQTLTDIQSWRYVPSRDNSADDITRGKKLKDLSESRWAHGPSFLQQSPDQWPEDPGTRVLPTEEMRAKSSVKTFALIELPLTSEHSSWTDYVTACIPMLHGAAKLPNTVDPVEEREKVELQLIQHSQIQCFKDDFTALQKGNPVLKGSRLAQLDPFYDADDGLLRVGGRLRNLDDLPLGEKHPIVLDPKDPITQLIIKDYDNRLMHCGPERVFAEIRRRYWILRGREAVKKHQRSCVQCKMSRATPKVPKMSDLPPARLRLLKPPFYSTGIDCFGPFNVIVGRRTEKRWGIIYKCLTTRAVYLDLLENLTADSFLMSLRCFISRRGKPFEILSDCGTNFKGGASELNLAWKSMEPTVRDQLALQRIRFRFNPPQAPHFGGTWEREIKSIKNSLRVTLGSQRVSQQVLHTVLIEVEGLLNSKPLGYTSSDIRDVDPITPNMLIIGRRDSNLPQIVYPVDEIMERKRWRHSQTLADQFWRHFIKSYLPSMQPRCKWTQDQTADAAIAVDDVVMIVDSQLVRNSWLTGRVMEVYPSTDGRIRSAKVKCDSGVYVRPVAKLIKLPNCDD